MKNIFILSLLLILANLTWGEAGVRLVGAAPNYSTGQYEESNIDLSVKVIGGYVRVQRNFNNKKWQFNRGAKSMEFNYGREHDSLPNEITISGVEYTIDDNSVNESATQEDPQAVYFAKADSDLGISQSRIEKYPDNYKWQDNQGNWIDYNSDGQITQGGNANTVTTKTVLDVQGRIFQVLGAKDNLVLTYDYLTPDSDKIKQISDYSGRSVAYQYNEAGQLVKVTDVLGYAWLYEYSISGELTKITNPAGQARHVYYVQGNVTAIKDDASIGTEYSYDYNSLSKQYYFREKHSSGSIKESTYNSDGLLIGQKIENVLVRKATEVRQGIYKYRTLTDASGNRIKQTLDQNGNILTVERNDGAIEQAQYNGPFNKISQHTNSQGAVTEFNYDAKGNILSVTQAVGTALSRTAQYQHDDFGQLIKVTYLGGNNTQEASYQISYDNKGNRLSQTDALGNVTTFTSSVDGQVITMTDARNNSWRRTLDAVGNLLTTTDPLNRSYTAEYNKIGQRIKVTAPSGRITQAQYDQKGRTISVTWPQNDNAKNQILYDDINQKITSVDALGFPQSQSYNGLGLIKESLDANGNQTLYHYNGLLLNKIDYPTFSQNLFYDAKNRLNKQTLSWMSPGAVAQQTAQQQTRQQGFNTLDQITEFTDALNNKTQSQYDVLGRLISRTGALNDVTAFSYDSRNNLTQVTDAEGRVTQYSYDKNNRKVSEVREPQSGQLLTRSYQYDANGNLIVEITPNLERIEHDYDSANQKIVSRYYMAENNDQLAQLEKTVTYRYSTLGQLIHLDDGISKQDYQYNLSGQLTQTDVDFGAFSKTLKYTYDKRGQKISYTNPEGLTYQYQYDGMGNITQVKLPQNGQISFLGYQGKRPNQILFPGGLKQVYSYDGLSREFSREVLDAADNNQAQAVYSYDQQNNITGISTEHGAYQYDYDSLYRLTSADNPNSSSKPNTGLMDEDYSYDLVHNRTSSHSFNNWSYSDSNQLLSYGDIETENQAFEFEYNNNGHLIRKAHFQKISMEGQPGLITKSTTRYEYDDASERLIKISDQLNDGAVTVLASYQYNPLGQRIAKTVQGITIYYLYDQTGLLAEYTSSGQLISEYHYTPNTTFMTRPLFKRDAYLNEQGQAANDIYFYQNDHLGTPQKLFAKNGELVWVAQYQAFGQTQILIETIENNLRFPGQYYDGETNTHYNYYRDYDPSLGRYIESDPIGLSGGVNSYIYVGSSPIFNKDPFGLWQYTGSGNYSSSDLAYINSLGTRLTNDGWDGMSAITFNGARGLNFGGNYIGALQNYDIYNAAGALISVDEAGLLLMDYLNIEVAHEHLFGFKNGEFVNFGYGSQGLFEEDFFSNSGLLREYVFDTGNVKNIDLINIMNNDLASPGKWTADKYFLFGQNCQRYVSEKL